VESKFPQRTVEVKYDIMRITLRKDPISGVSSQL